MEKEVISIEAAAKEWNEFLDSMDARSLIPDEEQKNGDEKQRGEYNARKNSYDKVVRAISRGVVVIENGVITQRLQFPVKAKDNESIVLDKLVFNQRVAVRDREEIFKNINDKDAGEALLAQRKFCSKLTGVDMILLGKVDLFDAKVTDQIVSVFFM
jgi:hypothetical protein